MVKVQWYSYSSTEQFDGAATSSGGLCSLAGPYGFGGLCGLHGGSQLVFPLVGPPDNLESIPSSLELDHVDRAGFALYRRQSVTPQYHSMHHSSTECSLVLRHCMEVKLVLDVTSIFTKNTVMLLALKQQHA